MVYDYHPISQTLLSAHFQLQKNAVIPESVLWAYISQLISAMKAVHDANLSIRVIDASKILLTGKNRIRINACGIFDILTFDGTNRNKNYQVNHKLKTKINITFKSLQQDDLLSLGHLIIALATGTLTSVHFIAQSIDYISKNFSTDLKNSVLYLMSKPSQFKSIDDVITMIGPRLLQELNQTQS